MPQAQPIDSASNPTTPWIAPELYILLPQNIKGEQDSDLELLYCHNHDNLRARVELAGLVTASYQLFAEFGFPAVQKLIISGGELCVSEWGKFLVVSRSGALNDALLCYLRLYLPDLLQLLGDFGLRFVRVLLEYYVRNFVEFCLSEYAFTACCASHCVPENYCCADLVINAFFALKNSNEASWCVFHGGNCVYDGGFDPEDKLDAFMHLRLKGLRKWRAAMDISAWEFYEPPHRSLPPIDLERVENCPHVPIISAGVAYGRCPLADAAGFSRDGELEQSEIFLRSRRELAVYEVKIDIFLLVIGKEDPGITEQLRHHGFLNQNYQLRQLKTDYAYLENRQLGICQGLANPENEKIMEFLSQNADYAMLKGIEVEERGHELVFK